jgi:hypothetical protein
MNASAAFLFIGCSWELSARRWEMEKTEDRRQKSEVRGQKSEVVDYSAG